MTKIFIIILIIFILIGITYVLINNNKSITYQSITPVDAKARLETDGDIVLLDVRTVEEYDSGHIPGSILIPLDILEQEIEGVLPDKNQEIIVYCRSGRRSKNAVNTLITMGYKNVYDLGGILDWPYEIETK